MKLLSFCNHAIEYLFYALFFFTPLALSSDTFELFEFNKMWLVFALTVLIAMVWIMKMIVSREVAIPKTPLDIPIALFLASQIIATVNSLDPHVSLWGYYSRFNGGLLSTISFVTLYYAFLSNFLSKNEGVASTGPHELPPFLKKSLLTILISGAVVAAWGLPSHFGFDPTCLMFRGTLDVSCWTEAFQPKIRMFSTLGQPAWLAAYLLALTPLAMAMSINKLGKSKRQVIMWLALAVLFYIDLLYTTTRSGFVGMLIALLVFAGGILFLYKDTLTQKLKERRLTPPTLLASFLAIALLLTFLQGTPFTQLNAFTFTGIRERLEPRTEIPAPTQLAPVGELGGTDSGEIRAIVWRGAIEAWKQYPIFGSGVETFAFAYYLHRPAIHNMTSEWDFLYNKAHNEYLNYLTTTGIVGLGSYLLIIGTFLFFSIRQISKSKFLISNQAPNQKSQLGQLEIRSIRNLLSLGIISGFIGILVSNFFGFSVVVINLFFFLFPALVFAIKGHVVSRVFFRSKNTDAPDIRKIHIGQTVLLVVVLACSVYCETILFLSWMADKSYAIGYNLDRANEYQTARQKLVDAMVLRPDEPVFQDELSVNTGVLATAYAAEKDATTAAELTEAAITISDYVVATNPNNVTFWKTRVRLFYTLSQIDEKYLTEAVEAIEKASSLAPTDAKISYNLGLLYGQSGDTKKAVEVLRRTIELKPDYRDAYYALGLYYRELAVDEKGNVINEENQKKAEEQMQFILEHLGRDDTQAKESLDSWKQE